MMNTAQYVYLFAMVVGMGYVLLTVLIGEIGGGDADMGNGDFDVGGHDFDAAGHDLDGGGDIYSDAPDGIHFSPFSPLVIASFAGAFGAVGLMGSGFGLPTIIHMPAAIGGGVTIGFVIAWLMAKLNQMSRAETGVTSASLIGCEALVSVNIPATGNGEITYESRGSRFNSPAQSEGKIEINKGAMVTISRIVGNTFFVKPNIDEKLRSMENNEK